MMRIRIIVNDKMQQAYIHCRTDPRVGGTAILALRPELGRRARESPVAWTARARPRHVEGSAMSSSLT